MRRLTTILSMLVLATIACNMPALNSGNQGDAPTVTAISATSSTSAVEPTNDSEATTAPTDEPAAGALPAPVYFISDDGQIWRVEMDAVTVTKITQEPATIEDFAISPADGSVVYISNNALIKTDAMGGNRAELFNGGPPPAEDDFAGRVNATVGGVSISPDGGTIAFGYGGVHLYSVANSAESLVLPSDPYPAEGEFPSGEIRFYSVGEWSPTGEHLLVPFGRFPEAGGLVVLQVASGTLIEFSSPDGLICCNESWNQDGTGVYFGNNTVGMIVAGLWRATLSNPTATTLIHGESEGGWMLVHSPRQLSDGKLYYFFAMTDLFPEGDPLPLTMVRSEGDGLTGRTELRSDSYVVEDALWHPDGLGAVIVDTAFASGTLIWLPADGSAAVTLPRIGYLPQWGQ